MDKELLAHKLIIEVANVGTSDIKLLEETIYKCLNDYSITKHTVVLPSSGDGKMTLMLFEQFAKEKLAAGLSRNSLSQYFLAVKKFYNFTKKDLNLCNKQDVVNYLAFYRQCNEDGTLRKKSLSSNTVQNRYMSLSTFYSWMYKNKYISDNPFSAIDAPKRYVPNKEILTSTEIERIIISCEKQYGDSLKFKRNVAILLFLIDSGLRCNELCQLRVKDIDLTTNQVKVIHGKGNKSRQTYFTDRGKERLTEYLNMRGPLYPNDFVFTCLYHSKPLSVSGVENILRHMGHISGVVRLHPHLCRTTFATNLISKNVSPVIIQKWLGHESLDTLKSYLEVTDNMTASAVLQMK